MQYSIDQWGTQGTGRVVTATVDHDDLVAILAQDLKRLEADEFARVAAAEYGIEIPFPQRDIHVVTGDKAVIAAGSVTDQGRN